MIALRRDVEPDSRFRAEGIEERCVLALGDLTDYPTVLRVLNEHEVEEVFHLAAQAIVGAANRSPLSSWEANIRGTYTLLEACRTLGTVRRVVVASSDKAYGVQEPPYREDLALRPVHPYDVSKASADMIARCYAQDYGLRVAISRLANVYGPGDINWSRIVPDTARALARGERPVIRSDGTAERDYLYVEDAVEAYLAISGSLDRPELNGRAWNAGCERPIPVIELVRTLISVSGRDVEPDIQGKGAPPGELERQYLDSTAIRDELGWEPTWDLERGLRASWEWYRGYFGAT